jgi:hypothetical protein
MSNDTKASIILLLTGILAIPAAWGVGRAWKAYRCADVADEAKLDTKYSIVSGCYVNIGGKWIPEERWRALDGQ